jgi:hypothetical protein
LCALVGIADVNTPKAPASTNARLDITIFS